MYEEFLGKDWYAMSEELLEKAQRGMPLEFAVRFASIGRAYHDRMGTSTLRVYPSLFVDIVCTRPVFTEEGRRTFYIVVDALREDLTTELHSVLPHGFTLTVVGESGFHQVNNVASVYPIKRR